MRNGAGDPPRHLLTLGKLGLLLGLAGRMLGGAGGYEMASAGVGITAVAGMFFFARLLERVGEDDRRK
jgi:hypothetical protein